MGNGHSTISKLNRAAASSVGLHSFRHLSPGEAVIWLAFLQAHPWVAKLCQYDVELGRGACRMDGAGAECPPAYARLLRKRVDVIIRAGGVSVAVEAKAVGGAAALGQAMMYRELLRNENPHDGRVEGCCVCGAADQDCIMAYAVAGIALWAADSGWVSGLPEWAAGPTA